jgi:hypothetical protein
MNNQSVESRDEKHKRAFEDLSGTVGMEVSVDVFDVRYKNEMPNIEDFDIFISSGRFRQSASRRLRVGTEIC